MQVGDIVKLVAISPTGYYRTHDRILPYLGCVGVISRIVSSGSVAEVVIETPVMPNQSLYLWLHDLERA